MKNVVAITTGNGMVYVHKVGCADIAKKYGPSFEKKCGNSFESMEALMEAYLDTGDPNEPGYIEEEFKIFGCSKGL